jgi:hypothetical protein
MLILIVALFLLSIGVVLLAKKSDPSSQVGPAWTYNTNCRKPAGEIQKDGFKQTCFTKKQMEALTDAEKKGECGKMNRCP